MLYSLNFLQEVLLPAFKYFGYVLLAEITIGAVAVILSFIYVAFRNPAGDGEKSNTQSAARASNIPAAAQTVVAVNDDTELIAVITAAISAVYESENDFIPPFRIRTIKLK